MGELMAKPGDAGGACVEYGRAADLAKKSVTGNHIQFEIRLEIKIAKLRDIAQLKLRSCMWPHTEEWHESKRGEHCEVDRTRDLVPATEVLANLTLEQDRKAQLCADCKS